MITITKTIPAIGRIVASINTEYVFEIPANNVIKTALYIH